MIDDSGRPVLISAHRCGARELGLPDNSRQALLTSSANRQIDYIEFDLQVTGDRQLVVNHDPEIVVANSRWRLAEHSLQQLLDMSKQLVSYQQALTIIAAGGQRAHIDLKFPAPSPNSWAPEQLAAELAVDLLGPERVLFTSKVPESLAFLAAWGQRYRQPLALGLSFGSEVAGRGVKEKINIRRQEFFPAASLQAARANFIVPEQRLARWRLAPWAQRQQLPMLVWTVDQHRQLRYWLNGKYRPAIITSNYPQRALALRTAER